MSPTAAAHGASPSAGSITLLLGWLHEVRERLSASLAERPAGERPLPAIRAALLDLADVCVAHRERTLAVARLSVEVPSLGARYLEHKRAWEDLLATDVGATARSRRGVRPPSAARRAPVPVGDVGVAGAGVRARRRLQRTG